MTHACLARRDARRAETAEIVAADTRKKNTTCLGCGSPMFTDRCHRICKACLHKRDAAIPPGRVRGRALLMSPLHPSAATFNFAGSDQ